IRIMMMIFLTLWRKNARRFFLIPYLQRKGWKFWFDKIAAYTLFIPPGLRLRTIITGNNKRIKEEFEMVKSNTSFMKRAYSILFEKILIPKNRIYSVVF